MSPRERSWAWAAIFAVFVLFLMLFQAILLPFVAGLAIAYFLDPLADRLERLGIARGLAAMLTLAGFIIVTIAVLLLMIPVIQSQVTGLTERLPDILATLQRWLMAGLQRVEVMLEEGDVEKLREGIASQLGRGVDILRAIFGEALKQGAWVFELLSLALVTPVVAFYLLRDWDKIVAQIDDLLPLEHRETVREQARHVDEILAGFVRGQATVCVLLGLGYGGALALVGLPFGFTVGLLAGLVSFVPYLGSVFGLVASVGLALVEFSDPVRIGMVAAIFVVGQVIEGNVLTPKLVGDKVRLHPVWVIFALFAGGTLMGFLGMLIALPVAAVIGVGVRFLVEQYRQSRLYDPEDAA